MKRKQFILGAVSLAVLAGSLLAGCGKKGGEEYVGTWLEKDRRATTIQIERNGDGYLMKTTSTNRRRETSQGTNAATLKDGALNFANGPVTGTVTYVKAQDEILVSTFAGNAAFSRVK